MYSPARRPFRGRHPSLAGLGVPAAQGQVVHRGRATAGLRGPGRGGCRLGATRTPVWTPAIVPSGTPGWAQHHAGTCGWTHRDGRGGRTAGSARSPPSRPTCCLCSGQNPPGTPTSCWARGMERKGVRPGPSGQCAGTRHGAALGRRGGLTSSRLSSGLRTFPSPVAAVCEPGRVWAGWGRGGQTPGQRPRLSLAALSAPRAARRPLGPA